MPDGGWDCTGERIVRNVEMLQFFQIQQPFRNRTDDVGVVLNGKQVQGSVPGTEVGQLATDLVVTDIKEGQSVQSMTHCTTKKVHSFFVLIPDDS